MLSSVTWFFGVRNWALLSERDVPYLPHENWAERVRGNSSFEEGGGWAYDPNWDGVVQGTESWERLEGIEPLYVLRSSLASCSSQGPRRLTSRLLIDLARASGREKGCRESFTRPG